MSEKQPIADCVIMAWDGKTTSVVYWNAQHKHWCHKVEDATLYVDHDEPMSPPTHDMRYASPLFRRLPGEVLDVSGKVSSEQKNQVAIFSYLKILVSDSVLIKAVATLQHRGFAVSTVSPDDVMGFALSGKIDDKRSKSRLSAAREKLETVMSSSVKNTLDRAYASMTSAYARS